MSSYGSAWIGGIIGLANSERFYGYLAFWRWEAD
jgi:hypothetical protein